ncbi:MAG: hypothetical protein GF334_04660 [Candidatus Altiarchaeales archaeon]|nr:hypothetical protein [Candidatus Altiarchaeales archaeon]
MREQLKRLLAQADVDDEESLAALRDALRRFQYGDPLEREVDLMGEMVKIKDIHIPDMWHVAEQADPRNGQEILYLWHLAHNLRKEIAGIRGKGIVSPFAETDLKYEEERRKSQPIDPNYGGAEVGRRRGF